MLRSKFQKLCLNSGNYVVNSCQSMLEHVRACQNMLEHVRAGFTCQGMVNMLRSQFQKLCLNSDKYGVNSRKYRLAMLTVFSMLAVFAMLAISWFIEIGIRSSLLHSCVLQTFFCSRFTELQTCRFDCFGNIETPLVASCAETTRHNSTRSRFWYHKQISRRSLWRRALRQRDNQTLASARVRK